jgi:hypothetical protein
VSKVILDDELKAKLGVGNGPTELCEPSGKPVAYVVSAKEYMRLLYDQAWAESNTPEAEAERQAALEAYRRGDYVTSKQLFEELRQLGYMPRAGR